VPGAGNSSLLTKAKQDMKAEGDLIVLEAAKTRQEFHVKDGGRA
jgi:hypothetical protein